MLAFRDIELVDLACCAVDDDDANYIAYYAIRQRVDPRSLSPQQ